MTSVNAATVQVVGRASRLSGGRPALGPGNAGETPGAAGETPAPLPEQLLNAKPKLLFFQYRFSDNLPAFVLLHRQQQVKSLSEFFEVAVIQSDCDYQRVCEKHEPDPALFEMLSGNDAAAAGRPEIANVTKDPHVPKLAFFNADAWCEARAGFISDMDRWGIETAFSICTTALEHMPGLAGRLFVWPNFIDPGIYRDYGEVKMIPVLLAGVTATNYPWRRKMFRLVTERYPALVCPHGGYIGRAGTARMLHGEVYARAINASWFAPTCGTVAKEVLRKHLEIPACKACLVTESSPALEAAGFVDMQNCVFGQESDAMEKMEYLFEHPQELERIVLAGYELVHSRHTLRQRDQILQWFTLHKGLEPGESIVQPGPFEALAVRKTPNSVGNTVTITSGAHLRLLRQGDSMLWSGNYEEAETLYRKASNYIPWMPEPTFRLALCRLYRGDARAAYASISGLSQYVLAGYKAMGPDPIEWAYSIVALLCLGELAGAAERAGRFPWLCHPELDRARWAVGVLKGVGAPAATKPRTQERRYSIHELPDRSLNEWVGQICKMLRACGQRRWAEALSVSDSQDTAPAEAPFAHGKRDAVLKDPRNEAGGNGKGPMPDGFEGRETSWRRKGQVNCDSVRATLRRGVAHYLHGLEAKWGYFLPYHVSSMRRDEFFEAIEELAGAEEIKTAIALGAASGEGTTEAFRAGLLRNRENPAAFFINSSTLGFRKLARRLGGGPVVTCFQISSSASETAAAELESIVKRIKKEHRLACFDAVLIDASRLKPKISFGPGLKAELGRALVVMLDDINGPLNCQNYNELLRDPNYMLVASNPGLRNGYAIFKRNSAIATTP